MKLLYKNKNKKSTLLTVIAFIFSLNSVAAELDTEVYGPSENGGNYNGSDLAGPAIPTQTDRAYSILDLRNAYTSCFKREVVDPLSMLICNETYSEEEETISTSLYQRQTNTFSVANNCFKLTSYSYQAMNLELVNDKNSQKSLQFTLKNGFFYIPYFIYDTEVSEEDKDDLGRVKDESNIKLINLKLTDKSNETYAQLFNTSNEYRVESMIYLNLKAYSECLTEKIQVVNQ